MTRGKISGYYVNSILAKQQAKADGYDEAILLDPEGYVAEGTGENVFIVRRGVLKTTPLTSVLEGITRNSVIQLAQERNITVIDELLQLEHAFEVQGEQSAKKIGIPVMRF